MSSFLDKVRIPWLSHKVHLRGLRPIKQPIKHYCRKAGIIPQILLGMIPFMSVATLLQAAPGGVSRQKRERQPVLLVLAICLFTYLGFSTAVNATVSSEVPEPEVPKDVPELVLWLDAEDVYGDGDPTNKPKNGDDVTTWYDKSGSEANMQTEPKPSSKIVYGVPTYLSDKFNGKAALKFNKDENDAMHHILDSAWKGEFSLFIVFQLNENNCEFNSLFSNGKKVSNDHFQVHCHNGSEENEFAWLSGTGNKIRLEPLHKELNLYTVRADNTATTTFDNGVQKAKVLTQDGRTFDEYRLNINRRSSVYSDSLIAEVILFKGAISDNIQKIVESYLRFKYNITTQPEPPIETSGAAKLNMNPSSKRRFPMNCECECVFR
jgi:hypothetical protein